MIVPGNSAFSLSASLKNFIKTAALKAGVEIRRIPRDENQTPVVSYRPSGPSIGNVLLSHAILPFQLKEGERIPHSHAGHWRGVQIAKTFVELNYSVDVIDVHDHSFVPEKNYSFFIDFYENLERLAPLLNPDCVKILYIQMAYWTFQNSAEYRRLWELLQRRGISLNPKRQLTPHRSIEFADCAILHGNDFVLSTFKHANKPAYCVPMSTPVLYPWPDQKDWESCRTRFVWFGNHGFLHKGLDLVLEAFTEMPEYELVVCGELKYEKEFVKAFHKELYETPNIHTIGWVDTHSPAFLELANSCVGTIYPACSEGGSGSIIHCMHAGIIPIMSRECGVDLYDNSGILLRNCSIDEIKEAIRTLASLPARDLEERARKAWSFVRANHTRDKFAREFKNVIVKIANDRAAQRSHEKADTAVLASSGSVPFPLTPESERVQGGGQAS